MPFTEKIKGIKTDKYNETQYTQRSIFQYHTDDL